MKGRSRHEFRNRQKDKREGKRDKNKEKRKEEQRERQEGADKMERRENVTMKKGRRK